MMEVCNYNIDKNSSKFPEYYSSSITEVKSCIVDDMSRCMWSERCDKS